MSVLLALAAAASTASPCANAVTTLDMNACLARQQTAVEADLNRYYGAAVKRLRAEKGDALTKALPSLIKGQRAWLAYRDGECGAVEAYWNGGTIRTAMALNCRISLTRLRVFSIWRDWLTYADSTPPILPRPDLAPVIAETAG
ncbi:lysozyme inhibitor LprI family protein [uncultured Caulobacter sp.]|uniref:lysozyme inhibitor LprI family protein n=1 Tax=uncultured Caulobacter sp. TaxID=158749 RepID=UPI00262B520F|nr:lysozyme inhibitor LprI family protein [uncultured Caulobacter sp.]